MSLLPNLLRTRRGRLVAFFLLCLAEGRPQGFATSVMATFMRRQGIGLAAIGSFIGVITVPWAFKWALGSLVDADRALAPWQPAAAWTKVVSSLLDAVPVEAGLPLLSLAARTWPGLRYDTPGRFPSASDVDAVVPIFATR